MSLFSELIVRGRSVFQMNSAAETATGGVPDGTLRLYNDGTNSFLQVFSLATGTWDTLSPDAVAAALYAPIAADYLVGTTNGTLTGEIVAGTAPGGELGGTWGSPTVDTVHAEGGHAAMIATHTADGDAHHAEAHTVPSHTGTPGGELVGTWTSPTVDAAHGGGSHAATQAAAEATADAALTTHEATPHGSTFLSVASDITYTADTTLATLTGLSFTGVANADYAIWGCLMVTESNPGGDIDLKFTVPTGAVAEGQVSGASATAVFDDATEGGIGLVDGATVALPFSAVLDMAGTGGTVGLQAAQNGATGSLIVRKGSWMAVQAL
jgi:hypothetical protein